MINLIKSIITTLLLVCFLLFTTCTTPGINYPPQITSLTANPDTIVINQDTTLTCIATDPDGDNLTYAWNGDASDQEEEGEEEDDEDDEDSWPDERTTTFSLKANGTITGSGKTVTWKAPSNTGTYTVICTISDGRGGEDTDSVNITVVSEPDINGDITNVSPLTDPFTLDTWYTTYVYVENTGSTSHTFKFKASEPSGTDFEVIEKSITLSAGATNSVSFKYKFYGTETCRSLTFKLYDSSNNLLDTYTTGTLCPDITTLSAPTGVSASDGTYNNKVNVTWNSVSGASYYRVYRATSSGGTKTPLGNWQTSTYYYDNSVTLGTTYYYWIKAATSSSGANASSYSSYNTGYPKPPDIDPPTVYTDYAFGIGQTEAKIKCGISDTGGELANMRGVEYRDVTAGGSTQSTGSSGSFDVGEWYSQLSNLTSGHQYQARAYATNSEGTGYGQWITFNTLP